jgi:hypothetical protein
MTMSNSSSAPAPSPNGREPATPALNSQSALTNAPAPQRTARPDPTGQGQGPTPRAPEHFGGSAPGTEETAKLSHVANPAMMTATTTATDRRLGMAGAMALIKYIRA